MVVVENPSVFVSFQAVVVFVLFPAEAVFVFASFLAAVFSGAAYRSLDSVLRLMTALILSKWNSSQIHP
jgi:hypothetical protein